MSAIESRPSRRKRPDDVAILRRRITMAALLVTILTLIILDRGGSRSGPTTDQQLYSGAEARVVRVIDGDTIVIDLVDPKSDDKPTRVRLWGIDAPELARNNDPADPYGIESRDFAQKTLSGKIVKLIIEPHRVRDRWGRVLAHVQLENGDMFAVELLEAGLARADDRWPHRWIDWFAAAELEARRQRAGIWSE